MDLTPEGGPGFWGSKTVTRVSEKGYVYTLGEEERSGVRTIPGFTEISRAHLSSGSPSLSWKVVNWLVSSGRG